MVNKYDVYEIFLSRIKDSDLALLSEQDMIEELDIYLERAIGRSTALKNLDIDLATGNFSRSLTYMEKDILSLAMILEWVTPRVNNIQNMYNRISDKDYTVFSQSKLLDSLKTLRGEAESEFLFWHNKYQLMRLMENQ